MGSERFPSNKTKMVKDEDGLWGKITGRRDVVYLRNKYQIELDNAYADLVNMVHFIEKDLRKLKGAYDNSQRLKKSVEAHLEERKMLYESLENLLSNEKEHEKEMWFETLRSRIEEVKDKNITVIQKNKDTEVDSMSIGSTLDYPKHYPDSEIKSRYKKILSDIKYKEREIRKEREKYYREVSNYNYFITFFEKHIQKAEAKFSAYDTILKEATKKILESRYYGGILYKISSEKSKDEINIDTLSHRVDKFRETLEIIKKDLSQYQGRKFVEMQY
ncbi:MAG: LemA family protein [Candidatus Cloacimonetes bacterium]|nr:LemA family protein [Candidatus Cloacimonadota bacterium]